MYCAYNHLKKFKILNSKIKDIMRHIQLFITLVVLVIPSLLMAQPDPPGGPVPIDGGLGILLAAGGAYGIKKYRENKLNS